MRICAQCGKQDAPWYVTAACTCGAESRLHELPPAEAHHPSCRCVEHEVLPYPVRMDRKDLKLDAAGKEQLPVRWLREGWVLQKDGPKFYRVKILCRSCIGKVEETLARKREYEQLCKAARGAETMSYAQMLANQ